MRVDESWWEFAVNSHQLSSSFDQALMLLHDMIQQQFIPTQKASLGAAVETMNWL